MAASLRSSVFCFSRALSCFTSPWIWILLELREDALALHVAGVGGGVLPVGAELATAACLPRLTASRATIVGAALVADLELRLGEENEALRAVILVLRARQVSLVELRRVLGMTGVLVGAPHLEDDLVGLCARAIDGEEPVAVGDGVSWSPVASRRTTALYAASFSCSNFW